MLAVYITIVVVLAIAVGVCVANTAGLIDIAGMFRSLSASEASPLSSVPRPFDGMTSHAPRRRTISTFRPLREASAGGRHLMPLETIGKEMKPSGASSRMPPLETIDTGDNFQVYASG